MDFLVLLDATAAKYEEKRAASQAR
jgi:hypothetical protein